MRIRPDAGTPAQDAFCRQRIDHAAAGPGARRVNSLKKLSLTTRTPLSRASRSASVDRVGMIDARQAASSPASPSSDRWILKASAQRPELVQMLLVAFSRRICCSRVESVSTKPRRPSASIVSPAEAARHLAQDISLARRKARHRVRRNSGALPIDWPSPATMSAPICARRLEKAQRHSLGHHHDQQRALRVAASATGRQIAQQAEEIGVLHDDAGGLAVDQRGEILRVAGVIGRRCTSRR